MDARGADGLRLLHGNAVPMQDQLGRRLMPREKMGSDASLIGVAARLPRLHEECMRSYWITIDRHAGGTELRRGPIGIDHGSRGSFDLNPGNGAWRSPTHLAAGSWINEAARKHASAGIAENETTRALRTSSFHDRHCGVGFEILDVRLTAPEIDRKGLLTVAP